MRAAFIVLLVTHTSMLASGQAPSQESCDAQAIAWDVENGRRRPVIDAIGWAVSIPKKILLWDSRAGNQHVSQSTTQQVTRYLQYRQLQGVKVRVNQYDPIGEWDRLVDNQKISPGWKYSLGLLRHVRYTLLPGRIFGGDEYNPYTDTVSLYSDMPSQGLVESAFAYDVHSRVNPGTYAAVQSLPLVSMWHESLATDEVLSYISFYGDESQLQKFRQDLYARYGVVLGGELGQVLPDGTSAFQVVGAVAGHATAALQNRVPKSPLYTSTKVR